MKSLVVNAKDLLQAMQDDTSGLQAYLDRQTGAVVRVSGIAKDKEPLSAQYVLIEHLPSSAAWHIMEDFVSQQPAGEPREVLSKALKTKHPFSQFAKALSPYTHLHQPWSIFREEACLQLAHLWLENHEIEAELQIANGSTRF